MNSRERVVKALNHEEPDRVPVDLGGSLTNASMVKKAHDDLRKYLNIEGGNDEFVDWIMQIVRPDERILKEFEVDVYGIGPRNFSERPPKDWKLVTDEDENYYYYQDEWGIKYRMSKREGYYFEIMENPLANSNMESLKDYQWPDPHDPRRWEGLEEEVKNLYENTDYALFLNADTWGIFEKACALRGTENFYIDLIADPKFAQAILDKMLEFYTGYWKEALMRIGNYIQIVKMGDDLGGQDGPLISPELYRRVLKPRHKEIFSFIRKRTSAKLYLHSDGSIYTLIPDIIECGVDVLNPIQVLAKNMGDTKRLKREFGDRLSFWGAIDTQRILPFGTPEDVEEEVKKRISNLAPGGGYILSAAHNIQPNVPPENVVAMYKAARKYGEYPILSS